MAVGELSSRLGPILVSRLTHASLRCGISRSSQGHRSEGRRIRLSYRCQANSLLDTQLTAIESLAGVDVLCSDKTGTLTANKLSLNEPYLAEGVTAEWFMTVAVLASSHNVKSLDPIDKVTVLALRDYPKAQEELQR